MNQAGELSAEKVVNAYSEEELVAIFKSYGELPNARKVASRIVAVRESREIKTTQDLIDVIQPLAPKFKEHKFFAQVFQAIRIEVNGELEVLKKFFVGTGCGVWGVGCGVWGFTGFEVANCLIFREKVQGFSPCSLPCLALLEFKKV